MKTIGLIGGMSWESTVLYYQLINRGVAARLGELHSARILLNSVEFQLIHQLQHEDRWEEAAALLASAAATLQGAGAELLLLCTNTMHKVAPQIEAAISIPFLHIADPTADAILAAGLPAVGLLGTRFTMEQAFYREQLEARGLRVLVPPQAERERVHQVIYGELCQGRVEESSRTGFRKVVAGLVEAGAGGIILGCTEIGMLLRPEDASVPLFDTTRLHAERAVEIALED